jgi:transposase
MRALSRPHRPRDVYQVQRLVPANKKVVIGDGAEWIWNLVAEHSPDGVQIVDLYQARQPVRTNRLWQSL